MRFRAVLATSFVLGAAAVSFAGCGIPTESNSGFVRGEEGVGGTGTIGGAGGARAGSAGSGQSGKAGTSAAGKGGGTMGSPCKVPADCDDANDCTADSCLATGCSYAPLLPGSACDTNRDKCDGVGNCQGSTCVIDQKTKIDPKDTDNCTEDLCDPVTGKISNPSKVKPSDSTLCTQTTCDPATGNPVSRDLSIDNDPCTYDECDLSVGPINLPKSVGDKDPCTIDSCDVLTGKIVHKPIEGCLGCSLTDPPARQAEVCDDGDPCTVDRCVAGGEKPICESLQVPNNTVIDADGTRCNGTLTCVNGVAKNLDIKVVDDGRACTNDSCDPATGVVKNEEKSDCIDCNSVDDCPKLDVECQSYKCEAKICILQRATGPTCNDGLACTTGDRCALGVCLGAPTVNPTDNNACTTNDRCTEPAGTIVGTDLGNGCISCNGTDTGPCGDQTGGTLDAECVVPKCTSGKCDRTFEPPTKLCGAAPGNACEERGKCDGLGKCSGPRPKGNGCCITESDCGSPAQCNQPFACNANKCVAGGKVDCGAATCDPGEKQKVLTPTCNATTGGSCQPIGTNCQGACENGKCEQCTAGAADKRCKSGFCRNDKNCCATTPPACGAVQDCEAVAGNGCPTCQCAAGTCQAPLASGGGGAAGSGPLNKICR